MKKSFGGIRWTYSKSTFSTVLLKQIEKQNFESSDRREIPDNIGKHDRC
jgi:hypothetical protein